MTGSVDGRVVHRGLLQGAVKPEVFVLDDRFFVAMETSPGLRPVEECPTCSRPSDTHPPTLWLIDSVSGGRAELTWRDEPTTVSSGDQALLVSDGQMSVPPVALKSGANFGLVAGAVPAPSDRRS